ncbi:MAG TPA: DMT family transporter [Candidatus Saccharimonadia bacterium]|nr:DMT family transporter [Candidatus Saccharimonadia bacterium]
MVIAMSVLLGLVSMVAYAAANVWSQPLVRKYGSPQVLFMRGLIISGVLALTCLPLLHRFSDWREVLLALGLGVAGYIPVLAFMQGLKVSRVGIVAPIGATSALITVILAFTILNTPLHAIQWFAIALVIAANVAISVNLRDLRNSNVMQLESGVLFGLIAALGWGGFYFGLIYPTRALGPWVAAFLVELGVTFAAWVHIKASHLSFNSDAFKSFSVIGSGLCIVIGTVAYTLGVFRYNVGIVAVLSNSTALVSTLLAAYFFKEKLSRFEKLVAAAMIIGVVLVSLP